VEPEAKAIFINHAEGMWKQKRVNFCGSTLKKEAGSGSKLGRLILYGAGSGSKKFSTASTFLL